MATHTRVSIVSGDVHCAAVGVLKTLVRDKRKQDVPPAQDPRYMINVVTSGCNVHKTLVRVINPHIFSHQVLL